MKLLKLVLVICLATSPHVFAQDQGVKQYVKAHIGMLRAEINFLNKVQEILQEKGDIKDERLEKIDARRVVRINKKLEAQGFDMSSYYAFGAIRKTEIEGWLVSHPNRADTLEDLKLELEFLKAQFSKSIHLKGQNYLQGAE